MAKTVISDFDTIAKMFIRAGIAHNSAEDVQDHRLIIYTQAMTPWQHEEASWMSVMFEFDKHGKLALCMVVPAASSR